MLDWKLQEYAQSNNYPFHMPGHKRALRADVDPYGIDITEIDGFDNLHKAEGILKEAQQRAADLYGSQRAYYLVNGSTCGILAAISAAAKRGGEVLLARNCHKAVYHALELRELTAHYLYPLVTREGIAGAIRPEAVRQELSRHPDVQAVILTSPTYDGVVSDIAAIAGIVHENGAVLIVDEAHGAHFSIGGQETAGCFPQSAVRLGADVVIQSLHKTLPSLTQTALLHLCSDRVSAQRIGEYLDIFETSSPSYVLMAGMERCIRIMAEDGAGLLKELYRRLGGFYREAGALKRLRVLTGADFTPEEAFGFDVSKILVYTGASGLTGKQLYDILLKDYGLQMEMACGSYVLAMTSVCDKDEGFGRLLHALFAIDGKLEEQGGGRRLEEAAAFGAMYAPAEQVCTIAQAAEGGREPAPLSEAAGRTAAGFVTLYPPGVPLLVPGERISGKCIDGIRRFRNAGLTVCGLLPDDGIEVVICP